jgi:hypothetical protein
MTSRLVFALGLVLLTACSKVHEQAGPLSDADTVDVVGVLKDGGVDLAIAYRGPLDDSEETVNLLTLKVRNYAHLALDPALFTHYQAREGPVRIFVSCEHPVSARAKQALDSLRDELASQNTQLLLVKRMSEP